MEKSIENLLNSIEDKMDRIFCCPISIEKINHIEEKMGIKFPKSYSTFLNRIGLLQDLIFEDFIESEEELEREKEFINSFARNNNGNFFAFAVDGYGNSKILLDRNSGDETIYKLSHQNGKITETKQTFYDYVDKHVKDAIKSYSKRKLNSEKEFKVEFSFSTDHDDLIFDILKSQSIIDGIEKWEFIEKNQAGVSKFTRTFKMDGKKMTMNRLEYDGWERPSHSFKFAEPALELRNGSRIIILDNAFRKHENEFGYKLVRYGIL